MRHIILKNKYKLKGLGLIELIISVALINIIVLALGNILYSTNNLTNSISSKSEQISDLNNTLNYIILDFDRAEYFKLVKRNDSKIIDDEIVFIRKNNNKYNFYFYYLDKMGNINRYGANENSLREFLSQSKIGSNTIKSDIKVFKSEYDGETNTIFLYLEDKYGNKIEKIYYIRATKL